MTTARESCFHCGLPVAPDSALCLEVDGRERRFCCRGCHAVSRAIVEAGLGDYYRHRTAASGQPADLVSEQLQRLALYDHPDLQAGFVRGAGQQREASLILENVRCPACLWLNEQQLRRLPGVLDVSMDYNSEQAWVRWDESQTRLSRILEALLRIGYIAHPYDASHRDELIKVQQRRSTERLIFAGLLCMPVMQFSFASYVMGEAGGDGVLPLWMIIGRWTALLAVLAILVYPAQEFFAGAWNDLKRGRLGMDLPIVIGLGTALVSSIAATLQGSGDVYYDSIAMLVFLVLLARRFELRGRLAAARVADRLARVVPRLVRQVMPGSGTRSVPLVDIEPGDRVRVLPGELVPVDGMLVEGTSSFDESLLTGESAPVLHRPGEAVIGGARNIDQSVVLAVTHRSEQSTVSNMQRLLARALRSRPRSAVLAERAATWFVPVVLVIALFTTLLWLWLDPAAAVANTVSVLIVTCPCALALAVPVAITFSASGFAQKGILPLRMDAIEVLARAEVLALDKTGTLTQGRHRVVAVECVGAVDEAQARRLAAALELHSEHPIAQAFDTAAAAALQLGARHNHPGEGVSATIDGEAWRLGRPAFALAGHRVSEEIRSRVAALGRGGYTVVVLANDAGPQALFALADPPRAGIAAMLAELRALGVQQFAILSGDNQTLVDQLARELQVETALGGLRPEDKMAWVRAQQAAGRCVLMVGDGINDAATLSAANVSISFVHATDLAQGSSDFLLLGGDIGAIAAARRYAARTRDIILQNLWWAAGYNLCAVPAAAAGLIPPLAAAIGMSLSSLIVVGNSLRLRPRAERGSDARVRDYTDREQPA
jgi:Cu2+-exporting ATPase